jgi:glycogen debranching enzyme
MHSTSFRMAASMLFAVAATIHGQTFTSIPAIPFEAVGPVIRAHAEPLKPFTVAGERGVVLGQQDGTFEAWALPVKLLSHMTIEANVEGYTVPIDVNQQAAEIEVRPDRTTITYSHIAFTVRQIMFSPSNVGEGTGPVVLYEFDCLHPTDFTFRFTPELRWMWPERNEGVPGAEWVHGASNGGGFYVLHSDYPNFAGAVTIPGAQPGILAPYQERPQVYPIELKLQIDPARDHGRLFPLLMAVGANQAAANTASLGAALEAINQYIPMAYHGYEERWKAMLTQESVSISTPDKTLDDAFKWAIVAIEQLKTNVPLAFQPKGDPGPQETALVAGYYASGDSARPGFGWFFGRDALYTLYAVNGYGDFALSRDELEFLTNRQRADGKIMHEYSQTAAYVDWQSFPYMYAAADSTPLYLLAMEDYLRATGDTSFVASHREAIEKAWAFETDPAHDTDHDGIYDNSQGTGWVESWPGHMPHQEIYLALLDQQASAAMAEIEELLGESAKSAAAHQRAETIARAIESEYYDPDKSCYAFSRNTDGTLDRSSTVYPALAWWSDSSIPGTSAGLAHPEACLQQFAAHTLNTDWGLRDVSTDEKFYDGMSYHQGSVWPLFTGWAALAEYRANQPLAGYQMLMENANLTRAQDLGADTELLSGDFFVPFGRSTSHQLWSSAMVITPTLRGLFGISIDAQSKTITVNPHLPANWDHAEIKNLRVGNETVDLSFTQTNSEILIFWQEVGGSGVKIRSELPNAKPLPRNSIGVPKRPVEIGSIFQRPVPGDRTQSPRVVREDDGERKIILTVEGPAGSQAEFPVLVHPLRTTVHAEGAELSAPGTRTGSDATPAPQTATIHFPPGDGWKTITVTLTW